MPFDLAPTEDEQQLVEAARQFAAEVLRPAAALADAEARAPAEVVAAGRTMGFDLLGVPEERGGVGTPSAPLALALVTEALAYGDMGLAVAVLAPGSVATAVARWGTPEQHARALLDGRPPRGALALSEPTVLYDAARPGTTATRDGEWLVLAGEKSLVPGGLDAELFVVGALLDDRPVLVLVEASTSGLEVVPEPGMGVRACAPARLSLAEVRVPAGSVLGATDGSTYTTCVQLSRLAWCLLGAGAGQAVLDHVVPYVQQREAFGEPIAHRQSVAFTVADLAIELESLRLLT
ncbi:MAG TPA: acyl-CoA dehydrogenase family protein, partial [Nocardioides sp.]|uniref:acyl-CoA dehydrogenase family protein n=1 Tax=Nocardioides sp. TaxID=35761 RepID=UPI002BC50CA9